MQANEQHYSAVREKTVERQISGNALFLSLQTYSGLIPPGASPYLSPYVLSGGAISPAVLSLLEHRPISRPTYWAYTVLSYCYPRCELLPSPFLSEILLSSSSDMTDRWVQSNLYCLLFYCVFFSCDKSLSSQFLGSAQIYGDTCCCQVWLEEWFSIHARAYSDANHDLRGIRILYDSYHSGKVQHWNQCSSR